MTEYIEDGYPTNAALTKIETWNGKSRELFDFVKSIWVYSDCGYWEEKKEKRDFCEREIVRIYASTAGWSGNEEIITSMRKNIIWPLCWYSHKRGGHYVFELDENLE